VRGEQNHQLAAALYERWRQEERRLVTTNYVLAELLSVFINPLRLARQEQFQRIDMIRTSRIVEIVHVDAALDVAAWAFLKSRADKEWSLIDAVSFLVMQERGITEALTTDHHFEQAGFVCLLKP
jgi:predicted nucleic acid-binding protein